MNTWENSTKVNAVEYKKNYTRCYILYLYVAIIKNTRKLDITFSRLYSTWPALLILKSKPEHRICMICSSYFSLNETFLKYKDDFLLSVKDRYLFVVNVFRLRCTLHRGSEEAEWPHWPSEAVIVEWS